MTICYDGSPGTDTTEHLTQTITRLTYLRNQNNKSIFNEPHIIGMRAF
jgi:hypothetical protein